MFTKALNLTWGYEQKLQFSCVFMDISDSHSTTACGVKHFFCQIDKSNHTGH